MRSELAVPMMARGKLVGVIDVQSTRLKAYREQDRALLRLIASRVAVSIDNARLVPPRGPAESHAARRWRTCRRNSARFWIWTSCWARSRRPFAVADQLRRVQHSAGGREKQGAAPPLQRALRPARRSRQHSAGQRNHRRGRRIARDRARRATPGRSALHRVASRYPFGNRRAADRAGPRGRRAGRGERAHRLLHRRASADAVAAGAADREFGGKRPAVRRTGPARAAHGSGSEGRAQAATCCCREAPEIRGLEIAIRSRPAREIPATSTISSSRATTTP